MLTVTDSTGTTVRTYDELSRVTSKTVPYIGKITYLYDIIVEDGLLAETSTDPKGNITTKVFDKAGRLKTVKDGDINSTVSTEYTYYPNGRRKSVVYPGGLSAEYTYYDNGMLKTLTNKRANGVIMDEYSYTYDDASNQDSKTEIINGVEKGTTSYTYDELNRLKTVTEPNLRKTTYTYDRAGNRETETIESGSDTTVNTYAYNDQDRLNSVTTRLNGSVTETTGFSYDDKGNKLTIRRNNELITTNEYNEKNQLVRTTTNGTTVVNTYNGEGLRVAKEVNGSLTRYMYEYLKVILEVDGEGKQVGRNLYGINLLMRDVDGESYYYMYNGNADVTALINSITSQIDATYYYDAFGNILESTGNVNNSITYKGYQWDEETGLYYLNARMYDPKIARFLQEDTYRGNIRDPLSLNLYAYVHNNPLIYFDPLGHSPVNIQVGDVQVRNAAVSGGRTTGNLEDIVKGLGGRIKTIKEGGRFGIGGEVVAYDVYLKNPETGIMERKATYDIRSMRDSDGNSFSIINGSVQGQVRELATLAGVDDTISWWHDRNKNLNVLVRPEMKYAPVKVVREGNNINVKAHINIVGLASQGFAWEEDNERLRERNNNYNFKRFYDLVSEGFKLWEGNYTINGENVDVNVDVITNNNSSNQKYIKVEVRNPSNYALISDSYDRNGQSHVKVNPYKGWSIQNNVNYVRLYTGYLRNGEINFDDWGAFKATSAHEFGHVLGISDAYDVGSERLLGGRRSAPNVIIDEDMDIRYQIPQDAIMRGGFRASNFVTDYDIKLMWDAFRTNTFQHYPQVDK
ncbi:UNVERIFIED_CONTAM: RHS repeat-associated protein [Acetivibrio alkalicellulosi]